MHGFTGRYFTQHPVIPNQNGLITNVTTAGGTSVAHSGVANTKSSYVELITSTSADIYSIFLRCVNAANVDYLTDLAVGGAGSESVIIPNIYTTRSSSGSIMYHFPGIKIASGSRIAARFQNTQTTGAQTVSIWLVKNVIWPVTATTAITYGADTANSRGVSVTSGNGSYGSWVQIDASTTSRNHSLWCCTFNSLSTTVQGLVEIAYGPNTSTLTTMCADIVVLPGSFGVCPPFFAAEVPSGSLLWARAAANTSAYRLTMHGI